MLTLQNELQKIGIEISEKIEYERIYEKIQWSLSILGLVVLPLWLVLSLIHLIIELNFFVNIILSILFIIFCITFLVLHILKRYVINWISSILDSNRKILDIDISATSLEYTICGFSIIYKNIEILLQWEKIIHWAIFYRENWWKYLWEKIRLFLEKEFLYSNQLLSNLKGDLNMHIEKEQSTLESAKSEVEKNIKWTTELNQISELQRARLDKQIKQFEDLQRLLINK